VTVGWAREWLRIRAIARTAPPLPLGLPIPVLSTAVPLEPGVFGIFRPVLLLPDGIAIRLTQVQLRAILAHELCHVRRRDNLTAAFHMLVEAVFWFHPLVWWLGARIVDERERACDEEVLQDGSHAEIYAETILKVCEFYLESPLTCMSGITGSDLKKRMERIMRNQVGENLKIRKKLLLATVVMVALALPVLVGVMTAPLRVCARDTRPS
jgi:beta-lactamase regulating signal transducer with metallopeptidase domain